MKLSIYSLQSTLYDGEIEKIIARTTTGEITVLNNHVPLISSLKGPEVKIIDKSQKINTIKIVSGFLEVRPQGEVVILANPA
jgi:F-type H+-transporting ATPase subunit epsilon